MHVFILTANRKHHLLFVFAGVMNHSRQWKRVYIQNTEHIHDYAYDTDAAKSLYECHGKLNNNLINSLNKNLQIIFLNWLDMNFICMKVSVLYTCTVKIKDNRVEKEEERNSQMAREPAK